MLRSIITEFKRKIDVENYQFGWVRFENRFFKIILEQRQKNVTIILQ